LDGSGACDSKEKHGCGGGLEHHLERYWVESLTRVERLRRQDGLCR
jgi:hypothetical protein